MQLKSCHTRVGLGLAAILLATPALAALKDRGPISATSGFPTWYRDFGIPATALTPAAPPTALQLCLQPATSPNVAGGLPMCFPPTPDENFYAVADAIATGLFGSARLVTALEAAYATGAPVAGQEIVFARIRLTVDTTIAGNYTITHPYGVEFFPNVGVGARTITFTEDIGLDVRFDGALNGRVGPFLRWDNVPAGMTLSVFNTTTGVLDEYLGDPNLLNTVTGSPFNTNFLQVDVRDDAGNLLDSSVQPLFTVVGQKYLLPIPTPLSLQRATYSRTAANASLDVFAQATAGQQLVVADANVAAPTITPTIMAANASSYLGHFVLPAAALLPATVTVTNTTDVPPSVFTANVTDLVTITGAVYDPFSGVLTISAVSSDTAAPPALTAAGFGAVDAAGTTFAAGAVPPASVTVSSSAGGTATLPVSVAQSVAAPPTTTLVAVNDAVSTNFNTVGVFAVTANDTNAVAPTLAAVVLTSPPAHGTAVAGTGAALGSVTYTPALNYSGPDSFSYVLQDANGSLSNVATVAVTVAFVAAAPVAVNDLMTTTAGVPNTSAILANDTAAFGTTLVPASVVLGVLTPATAGTATYSGATGLVTFTPATGFTGAASITYTVQNNFGQTSNVATLNIQVNAVAEVINVTRAQFRTGTSRWTVTGTSTVATGTVTIYNGSTTAAPVIGTAPIVAGAFNYDAVGGPAPSASRLILIRSSNGGQRVAAVTVRQ